MPYRKIYILLVIWMAGTLIPQRVYSQFNKGLDIYGYFQVIGQYWDIDSNPKYAPRYTSSFSAQQFNVFFRKQYDARFSAFINLEFTNSFSTKRGWGGMNLEEAWGRYDYNQRLKIKLGVLIPTFNNLNAIKNRTPLLPYIYRPIAYESIFDTALNIRQFVPQQAGIEIYGTFSGGSPFKFDYALFAGNQVGFVLKEDVSLYTSGNDTTLAKMVGGRMGVRYNGVKFGVSSANDKTVMSDLGDGLFTYLGTGITKRRRIGADFSYEAYPWFIESEYIQVHYALDAKGKRDLEEIARTNPVLNSKVDKRFFYLMAGRHFHDRYYAYAMYSYIQNDIHVFMEDGVGLLSVGGGLRLKESIVLKVQANKADMYSDTIFYFNLYNLALGLSILL